MVHVVCIEGACIGEDDWEAFDIENAKKWLHEDDEYDFEEYDFTDTRVIQAIEVREGENYIFMTKK